MQKLPVPSKKELEELLFVRMMSKKAICKEYNISKPTLSNWMKQHGLINKLTPEILVQKRKITLAKKQRVQDLIKRTLKGEVIKEPGFNSEFIEEYMLSEVK